MMLELMMRCAELPTNDDVLRLLREMQMANQHVCEALKDCVHHKTRERYEAHAVDDLVLKNLIDFYEQRQG